jgi:hypothetical protein
LIFLFLGCAIGAQAQSTTVSGTVTDQGSQAWFGGSYSFQLVPNPNFPNLAQYSWTGGTLQQTIAGTLDGSGAYSQSLPSNSAILPPGSTWIVTFCPLATSSCSTTANTRVTGGTQTINATPPAIAIAISSPGPFTKAYSDTEIISAVVAAQYYNLTSKLVRVCQTVVVQSCTVWANVGGSSTTLFSGVPTGSCTPQQTAVDTSNGDFYSCVGGVWIKIGPGAAGANVALKPTLPGIQYVSSTGNNSNDGLSPGSAKLTVYAALIALSGGSAGPPLQAGSGTLFLTADVGVGASDGGGLRFVGNGSAEYASPPTGWMRAPSALYVHCYSNTSVGLFSSGPTCHESWGSGGTMPAVWINGSAGSITFDGFDWHYQGTAIRLGINSSGNHNADGAQSIHFKNFSASGGGSALGWGPQIDIGTNVFWCYFDDAAVIGSIEQWSVNLSRTSNVVTATVQSGVAGTGGATHDLSTGNNVSIYATSGGDTSFVGTFVITGTADNQHFTYSQSAPDSSVTGALAMGDKVFGMTVNPDPVAGGQGSGLIEINRWTGTGIKFYGGVNGGSIRVVDLTVEAPFIVNPPGVWISGAAAGAFVSHVELADVTGNTASLVVDSAVNPRNVFAEFLAGAAPGNIDGKVYFGGFQYGGVLSSSTGGMSSALATPTRAGAFGIIDGHVYAQHDGGRRLFSPSAVRYANLAKFSPANWFFIDTGGPTHVLTTGISAPDGTTGASQVSIATGGQSAFAYHATQTLSVTIAVGQWFIGGAWVQSQTANGYQSNAAGLYFQLTGSGNYLSSGIGYQGSGLHSSSWEWVWFAYKVLGAGTPSTTAAMYSRADSLHTIQAYAPVLIQVPAGSLSDNEASDLAMHLSSYPEAAAPGEVAMLQGQLLRPGSTVFANLGTPGNGVLIYCSDCTVANPCAGSGTGALAKRLNGTWVCN